MTDRKGIQIRHLDRVVILPSSDLHRRGHHYGDVMKVGRKWVHVSADSGRVVRVAPADVQRINL